MTPTTPGQHVDISEVPGQPTLYTITLEGGLQIQAYVDPGEPGRTNQVHVTAFDADGKELPLHAATLSITPPEGAPFEPKMLRFGPGHFAANIDLARDVVVRRHGPCRDGQVLSASFRQSFEVRGFDHAQDAGSRPDRRDGVRPGRLRGLGRRREWGDRRDRALLRPPEQHREALDRRPKVGEVVHGSAVDLRVKLQGAKLVPATTTHIVPDEGHLHVILDDTLISMTQGLEQTIPDVPPGKHRITVEFVASDHAPFDPRVVSVVAFEVKP